MTRRLGAAGSFLALLCGCAALPDIAAGACGNGVVESREDCDTFAPDAKSMCRPKGTAGECHLDCRLRPDGTRPSCPTGWGCDLDAICRATTGAFDSPSTYKVGGASSLMAGDFDGDGRVDVLSREPRNILGRSQMRFHYFDEQGALAASRLFPKELASPVITDLSGDGRSDVVFTNYAVGLLLGQPDRSWVPETFGSYHIPSPTVRMVAPYDDSVEDWVGILAVTSLNGTPGFYLPDPKTGLLRLRGKLPGPFETLVGEIAYGNLIEDPETSPCRELVSAVKDATSFSVVDVCRRSAETHGIIWATAAEPFSVLLEPPAAIDAAPLIVDLNADGHLDVLVGAGDKVYASYGDGGGLSVATPYHLASSDPAAPDISMPLAAGDFTDDGAVDFVFDDHLLVSLPTPGSSLPLYVIQYVNQAAKWTEAKIADMNGNGKLDVVAASSGRLGIDFYNGTGSQDLTPFNVQTDRPVEHLDVGDFDGDLINDLAFVEGAVSSEERDAILIAFGAPAGPPIAPKVVARVAETVQITAYTIQKRGSLVISSNETVNGMRQGVISLLDGSGDRIPYAPYGLVTFSPEDGVFHNVGALAIAVGGFTAPRSGDVLAITSKELHDSNWQLWLVPALEGSNPLAARLDWKLDPRLSPAHDDGTDVRIDLVSASADLDGDGRDEALWAMPADDDRHCGLAIVSLGADGKTVISRGTVVLDTPCQGPELLPVDADLDGSIDIAILTGAPRGADRKLLVLWNDGKGNFSSSDATDVSGDDSPQGFTALAPVPSRSFSFAYVTDVAAMLVKTTAPPRHFASPERLVALRDGSGIVAADVNGDHAVDLVLAASGDLTVLKAELSIP